MGPMRKQIHVVFGESAAGLLRRGLAEIGRRERVVTPDDDFSFGPLSPDDAAVRARWVTDMLGYADWAGAPIGHVYALMQFITPVDRLGSTHDGDIIAWFSPDRASSLCGYLCWLTRIGDRPIRLNRITEMGYRQPEQLAAHVDSHVELRDREREDALAAWQTLVRENAPLRILSDAGLVSVPLEHFDAALLERTGEQWQKVNRVVAETYVDLLDGGGYPPDYLVLASRLRALARGGALEWQGNLDDIRRLEVRLPEGAVQGRGPVAPTSD